MSECFVHFFSMKHLVLCLISLCINNIFYIFFYLLYITILNSTFHNTFLVKTGYMLRIAFFD